MSRRKAAIVNVFLPPQAIGGATRVVADNLAALTEDYADRIDWVGFATNSHQQAPHEIDVYGHLGHRIYRAGALFRRNMEWHPRDEAMGDVFRRFLEFEAPDVVHFHCVQRLTGSVVEVTRAMGIPYLVTVHDAWWISDFQFLVDQHGHVYPAGHPDPDAPVSLPDGIRRDASIERREYLKGLLNDANAVLPVSEAFAEIYRRNGIHGATANRNGIRPGRWLPRVPSATGRVRIAHIGGMSPHKGFDVFREALAGSCLDRLEALVVDLSKAQGYRREESWGGFPVTIIGKVPQALSPELYANMDVLAAPSVWPESFGLVTREAAAAGVWVVASDIGAIGEDVRPGLDGDIVPAGDSAALREVFKRINVDPARYLRQMESRVLPGVGEQVQRLVELYERL